MDLVKFGEQIYSVLGVYAITVILLIAGIAALWKYIKDKDKRDREDQQRRDVNRDAREEKWSKIVADNTLSNQELRQSNAALIQRFDDFIRAVKPN